MDTPASWPATRAAILSDSSTCAEHLESAFERVAGVDDASHEHENHRLPSYSIEQCRLIAARFGGARQSGDGFERLRQLASHDARGRQPEHHLQVFRRLSEPLAQLASAGEGRHGLARSRPVRGDETRPQHQLKIELSPVLVLSGRQAADHLDAALHMRHGLDVGRAQGGVLAGLQPVSDGFVGSARLP